MKDEAVEFVAGQSHPEMPESLKSPEIKDEVTAGDSADAEATLGKLHSSHNAERTLVYPNPDKAGDTLTFVYKRIDPGTSLLLNDIAIVTGILYNRKHRRFADSMETALDEGRLEEYIQVMKNDIDYENKVISMGLVIPKLSVEEVSELLVDKGLRGLLFNAIIGGATTTDEDNLSDVDVFPEAVEQQGSAEASS